MLGQSDLIVYTFLEYSHQEFPLEAEVFKLVSFRVCDIGSLSPVVPFRNLQLGLPVRRVGGNCCTPTHAEKQ